MIKIKKKLLTELKQLKIRQRCIEKNINCSIKLDNVFFLELDDLELEFLKSVEKLKTKNEKEFQIAGIESKSIVQECILKVHQFQKNILHFEDNLTNNISSPRSNLLNIMAEINNLLSENLYIFNKELSSLKFKTF